MPRASPPERKSVSDGSTLAAATRKMLNVAVCVLSLASVSFRVPWFEAEKIAQFGAS